jgi:HlyD family type I secretion membrane fusion protein
VSRLARLAARAARHVAACRLTVGEGDAGDIDRAIRAGLVLGIVFFGCLGTWAACAPLTTGSFAPGTLAVDTRRKTVAHLDGGVVTQILVVDGGRVVQGQPLIVLDTRERAADRARLLDQFYAAAARQARLAAERADAPAIAFPGWLTRLAAETAEVGRMIEGEKRLLAADRARLANQQQILRQRVAQAQASRDASRARIASLTRQRAIQLSEVATIRDLYRRGLERRPRLLALERDAAALDAQLAEARAQEAQASGTIAQTRLELTQSGASQTAQADAGLVEAGRAIADLRQRIAACDTALRRSVIRAPVSGTVMNLGPAAPGAVIMAGEPLMDIVPSRDALVVMARVAPRDIDAVRPGLRADVHFLAFDGRLAGAWPGHVEQVSADSMTDSRTGAAYYRARVVLGPPPPAMKTVALHPGMPADVSIVTGTRTPLDYLLRPLKTSMRHAMRED